MTNSTACAVSAQTQAIAPAALRFERVHVSPAISVSIECGPHSPLAVVVRINPTLIPDRELCRLSEDMFWHTSAVLQRAREDDRRRKRTERPHYNGRLVALGIALSASLLGDCEVCIEIDPSSTSMAQLRNAWDRVFTETRAQVSAMRNYAAEVRNV